MKPNGPGIWSRPSLEGRWLREGLSILLSVLVWHQLHIGLFSQTNYGKEAFNFWPFVWIEGSMLEVCWRYFPSFLLSSVSPYKPMQPKWFWGWSNSRWEGYIPCMQYLTDFNLWHLCSPSTARCNSFSRTRNNPGHYWLWLSKELKTERFLVCWNKG